MTWWRVGFGAGCFCLLAAGSCGGHSEKQGGGHRSSHHPELCDDGDLNGNETDIDCGGPDCDSCPEGASCERHDDCESALCRAQTCQAGSCSDEVRNGDETDADCGGSCPACEDGKGCALGADCTSFVCLSEKCGGASCLDGVFNGEETDLDCGGPECRPCFDGSRCEASGDCASGICDAVARRCASCVDGVTNGSETDRDCGGLDCAGCGIGLGCNDETDCESGLCGHTEPNPACREAHCGNDVTDGDETDRNCGGTTCHAQCDPGQSCEIDSDCYRNTCEDGVCVWLCRSFEECGGGVDCVDGHCVQCTTDDDCTDGECRNGFCLAIF